MSLHDAAQHLASRGRGDDSLLIHMTPREVAGLDALARKHYGNGLTVNPDTGLPEAGILGSLLPVLAGAALTATGIGAPMAALMVGGGTTLMSGSLQKGLMAGLGAFGGAGLGEGLAGMGSAAAASSAAGAAAPTAALGAGALPSAASGMGEAAMGGLDGLAGDFGSGFASNAASPAYVNGMDAMSDAMTSSLPAQTVAPTMETVSEGFGPGYEATKSMSPWEKMQAGVGQIGQPGSWDAFKAAQGGGNKWMNNAMMAAAPLLSGGMSGNKIPKQEDKGMIRPYDFDQLTGRYTARTPIPASAGRMYAIGGEVTSAINNLSGLGAIALPGPQYNYNQNDHSFTRIDPPPAAAAAPDHTAGVGGPTTPMPTVNLQQMEQAGGGGGGYAGGGGIGTLLQGPGDGVSDSIPAQINGGQPAALADGEYIVPARVVSEIGNGSTGAGAKRLDQMVQRVQQMRSKTAGSKSRVAVDSGAHRALPA